MTFDIIFAVNLSRTSSPGRTRVIAFIASALSIITVALLASLVIRQARYRGGAHIQNAHRRQHTYLLAGFGGVLGILSAVASAILLGMMKGRNDVLARIGNSSTKTLVIAAFIVWAVSLTLEAVFIVCMIIVQRKDFQQQIQAYEAEAQSQNQEMVQSHAHHAPSSQRGMANSASPSVESRSPPSSSGRSRADSETRSSFRSSMSQAVRPISSKTRLISHSHMSFRGPPSIESSSGDIRASIEDGFDSWDTSTVDAQSREAVTSASPTPPRMLETIPASPTTSRSASPGCPLDLEPPKSRKRSRSYSPATSPRESPRATRNQSPTESVNSEAHIHPLFRTDSPTPPAYSPGTIVTAAPGAGQVISDRQSIRSIHRMRSGSLPSSPLVHSASLDSMRLAMERDELEEVDEIEEERTLTPPIPDFILNGGPRSSMAGYSRKKPMGLGMLGEVPDE